MYRPRGIGHVLAVAIYAYGLTGCDIEYNAVRPITSGKSSGISRSSTVVVVGFDATKLKYFNPSHPEFLVLEFARVDADGGVSGGGCDEFDRVDILIPKIEPGLKYFAFSVPPGLYENRMGRIVNLPYHAPVAAAFTVPPHQVSYLGTYLADGERLTYRPDVIEAARWTKARFDRLAVNIAPREGPPEKGFLCGL